LGQDSLRRRDRDGQDWPWAIHPYPAPIAGTRLTEMGVAIFAEDLFLD
jgi:hypothetical protein